MTEQPKILDAVAAKLDASPRVVNWWRHAWKLPTIKLGAFASAAGYVMAILQAEAGVAPLFGLPWLPQWALWSAAGTVGLLAIVLRVTKKPDKDDGADT